MRLGCCGSTISRSTDPVGVEIVEKMAEIGFDYIELSLSDLTALPEDAFAALVRRVAQSGIGCEACNNFFPPAIRLTGNEARLDVALDHAVRALGRAAELGVRIVVFGSSGAKNVPEGFPFGTAWNQIVALLRNLGPVAARHDITIAIEPLNRKESNIVNLAEEGLRLARQVAHPNIQLLIDFYHLEMEQEDPAVILRAGSAIRHLHIAHPEGRVFPAEAGMIYSRFFAALRQIRYQGRCSIEAYTSDFPADGRRALRNLRQEAENRQNGDLECEKI